MKLLKLMKSVAIMKLKLFSAEKTPLLQIELSICQQSAGSGSGFGSGINDVDDDNDNDDDVDVEDVEASDVSVIVITTVTITKDVNAAKVAKVVSFNDVAGINDVDDDNDVDVEDVEDAIDVIVITTVTVTKDVNVNAAKVAKVVSFNDITNSVKNLIKNLTDLHSMLLFRCGDVESNPGPVNDEGPERRQQGQEQGGQSGSRGRSALQVITQNVRGLGDTKKVRHLINTCYKLSKSASDSVFMFQETYVSKLDLVNFLWRGDHHLTSGNGNSLGCLTLVTAPFKIVRTVEIGQRGHIIALAKNDPNKVELIVANIYAPNGNGEDKVEFFNKVIDELNNQKLNYNCHRIFLAGDLNLVFSDDELQNRQHSIAEKRVAARVKLLFQQENLVDGWDLATKRCFTWTSNRSGQPAFSTLDRILFNNDLVKFKDKVSDWSLSVSDHAAVIATFELIHSVQRSTFISRLDPRLLLDQDGKRLLDEAFDELFEQRSAQWNPHVRLEFTKMCIRTAANTANGKIKARYRDEEKSLNEDINKVIDELVTEPPNDRKQLLMHKLDDLRQLKRCLVTKLGTRLEARTARKWYNEGELANKYFFNLLNRKCSDEINEVINEAGNVVRDPELIDVEIGKFYKNLYESVPEQLDVTDAIFRNIEPIEQNAALNMANRLTLDELERTLVTCTDSAPGPDGIPYSYLKHFWKSIGPILVDAWNYSLDNDLLPPSHKVSYLRLIPKAGKDTKVIGNLRPITLSNTDHKLITKTYAKKLTALVASNIGEEQTAYIPGRLINDNIRSMLMTIDQAQTDVSVNGILVSLDAKKAFDSVDHRFIKRCLVAFGLECFVPIFSILYKDLSSNIIVNGRPIDGYKILKGVKQGDALSCILFIMCLEPLIRNLKENQRIEPIRSASLNVEIPKVYGYADDVSVATVKNEDCVKQIFHEYELFSKESGLILNADKTDLLCFNNDMIDRYDVEIEYLGTQYRLQASEKIKINGIWFLQDKDRREEANVAKCIDSMERLLKSWSTRRLTLLGRILIIKTYAFSQCIYLMQSMKLKDVNLTRIMKVVYKYLWNRNFSGNKAPERIKRSIMLTPIKHGGFGLTNIMELSDSLDLKSYGRLLTSNHPLLKQVLRLTKTNNFFETKINANVDDKLLNAIKLLNGDRKKIWSWSTDSIIANLNLRLIISNSKLSDFITLAGKRSLHYLAIHRRVNHPKISQLLEHELRSVERFVIEPRSINVLRSIIGDQLRGDTSLLTKEAYPLKEGIVKMMWTQTSKDIRIGRSNEDVDMINIFKVGLILTPGELLSWTKSLKNLTSTRHRNILLRVAHGDIFSNARLLKFGLRQSASCSNCQEPLESIQHRVAECPKAIETWRLLEEFKFKVNMGQLSDLSIENLLGAKDVLNKIELALQAEIILRLTSTSESYCPNQVVRSSIELIGYAETLNETQKIEFKNFIRAR